MPIIDPDGNNYVNDPNIEFQWAIKAHQYSEVHFNLLTSLETRYLRLTKIDDEIYQEFRKNFKDLNVDVLDEDVLKSPEAKEIWRPFCENFKDSVQDYNMATLLRLNASLDYNEENTTIAPRIQFYAIEIARNREGFNEKIKETTKKIQESLKDVVVE